MLEKSARRHGAGQKKKIKCTKVAKRKKSQLVRGGKKKGAHQAGPKVVAMLGDGEREMGSSFNRSCKPSKKRCRLGVNRQGRNSMVGGGCEGGVKPFRCEKISGE